MFFFVCVCVYQKISINQSLFTFSSQNDFRIPRAGTISTGNRLIESVQKGSKRLFCGTDLGTKKSRFLVR